MVQVTASYCPRRPVSYGGVGFGGGVDVGGEHYEFVVDDNILVGVVWVVVNVTGIKLILPWMVYFFWVLSSGFHPVEFHDNSCVIVRTILIPCCLWYNYYLCNRVLP